MTDEDWLELDEEDEEDTDTEALADQSDDEGEASGFDDDGDDADGDSEAPATDPNDPNAVRRARLVARVEAAAEGSVSKTLAEELLAAFDDARAQEARAALADEVRDAEDIEWDQPGVLDAVRSWEQERQDAADASYLRNMETYYRLQAGIESGDPSPDYIVEQVEAARAAMLENRDAGEDLLHNNEQYREYQIAQHQARAARRLAEDKMLNESPGFDDLLRQTREDLAETYASVLGEDE